MMDSKHSSRIAGDSPPISANSIVLRHFVPEDAPKVFVMSQESGMRTWIPDQVYATEEEAREVVQYLIGQYGAPATPSLGPYVLGVCLAASQEVIGHVGLSPLDGEVEIGYAIEDCHQGKGIASEAVKAMSEWALVRFALPRILGIVATDNSGSCKVLENAGFKLIEEKMGSLHRRPGLVRKYEKTSHGVDADRESP